MDETYFEGEIREQPETLARLLRDGRAAVERVAAIVRAAAPAWVTIAARGTSDNAARYAQYALGARNRLSVALAAPSLFTVYASPPSLAGALVVGISQSGQSPDIVAVVAEGRRQGAVTIAVTNDPASPLARTAEHTLALHAATERAVAATKTYSTELFTVAMLSAALANDEAAWRELAGVPELFARALDLASPALAASRWRASERFLVLGRGFNYATAFEIALKIKETSYVITEPYSFADFLHGPAAMLERGFPVILVAPSAQEDASSMLELLDRRGADVLAISDDPAVLAHAGDALELPPGMSEWISPIVAIAPGQLFALALARARGTDPDRPRGLSKVTETR
ncbi:MAG: SIS domain-containing protein [Labilithrix sp.]|nr:SIS domain-containing protein [Labilithrix sp.]